MATTALFARFYRHPGFAILLQKQVSKASIAKIGGVSLPPFTALSRQGGYAHTLKLKGYFYTNLGGTLYQASLRRWEGNGILCSTALRSFLATAVNLKTMLFGNASWIIQW